MPNNCNTNNCSTNNVNNLKLVKRIFWIVTLVLVNSVWTILNFARYIEIVNNVRRRLCCVSGSNQTNFFLYGNVRLHTRQATRSALKQLKFEVIPHSPYSSDSAPCDFDFFPDFKKGLKGTHFNLGDEMKEAVKSWIKMKPATYFSDGIKDLVTRWEKCVSVNGDYVEK